MEILFVNKTKTEIPETFLMDWSEAIVSSLVERDVLIPSEVEELVAVFVDEEKIRELNLNFRSKDKATDVLSFAPVEESSLGELVFCIEVIRENAKEHKLSFEQELAYMYLHGVLHLLGFEHETNEEDAKEMFDLQDSIFENLSGQFC
ncbi:MAG: rRNA maturation RNase YbeY [Bdellovibrionota bacterium]